MLYTDRVKSYIQNFVQIPCKHSKSTIVAVGGIRVNLMENLAAESFQII